MTHLAHEIEEPVPQEAAEDVETTHGAVRLGDQHLERQTAVAGDRIAHRGQGTLQPEALQNGVGRLVVTTHVAQVGVGVVADQTALPHRPQQVP